MEPPAAELLGLFGGSQRIGLRGVASTFIIDLAILGELSAASRHHRHSPRQTYCRPLLSHRQVVNDGSDRIRHGDSGGEGRGV